MDDFLELRSPRLRLRRLQPGDAAAVCAYRALPARFQSWEPSYSLADAAELIASQERTPLGAPDTWLQLGLTLAESGELIGDCGIHCLVDGQQVELRITLSPGYQGRGLATETIECLLGYVFGSLGKQRVVAVTDAENLPAARLFQRAGFRQEAHSYVWFKGAFVGEFLFAIPPPRVGGAGSRVARFRRLTSRGRFDSAQKEPGRPAARPGSIECCQ